MIYGLQYDLKKRNVTSVLYCALYDIPWYNILKAQNIMHFFYKTIHADMISTYHLVIR